MQLELNLFLRSLINSLTGAAVGAGVLYAIAEFYRAVRKADGMGFGDLELMAMVGSFLGPVLTLFVLATSAIAGGFFGGAVLYTIYRKRMSAIVPAGRPRRSPQLAGGANRHARPGDSFRRLPMYHVAGGMVLWGRVGTGLSPLARLLGGHPPLG